MRETLEELLHIPVREKEFQESKQLPLFLKGEFEFRLFSIDKIDVLFVKPKQPLTFSALRKQWNSLEKATGLPCVVYGDRYSRYGRERMIELGIPFYYGKDNMYLPFLGIALGKDRTQTFSVVEQFSPATQHMILQAIYEDWKKVSTREISIKMQVSRITAARILTELQALDLPLVVLEGKTKYFYHTGSRKDLYQLCRGRMINPVIKTIYLATLPCGSMRRSGLSALSDCSMLSDNPFPTFGVTRQEFRELAINDYPLQPSTEVPVCAVQLLRYVLEQQGHVDPISAILSLPEADQEDPRIENAVEEILNEVLDD